MATTNFIWAGASGAPSNRDSASSSFPYHDDRGAFSMVVDLSPQTTTAAAAKVTSNNTVPTAFPTQAATSAVTTATENSSNSSVSGSIATSSFCSDQNAICVTVIRDTVNKTATITVFSTLQGWVGIGTGAQMAGSTMFIGWNNASATVISQRAATGEIAPSYNPSPIFTQVGVPASISIPPSATIVFAIMFPDSANIVFNSTATPLIYAGSNTPPSTPASAGSAIPPHDTRGAVALDVSTAGTATAGTATDDESPGSATRIALHSAAMFVAWGVLPAAGIFVARYLKTRWGHRWFLSHVGLMCFGVPACMIVGLAAVELGRVGPRFAGSPHAILGAVIAFGIFPLQIVLGFVSNALFDAQRRCVPWWDRLHWYVGRGVVVLAIAQIQLGLLLGAFPVVWTVLLWVWVVAVAAGLFGGVGEYLLGGVVHELQAEPKPDPVSTSTSSDEVSSPASFENDPESARILRGGK
ncbi:hypothetical protein HDU83_005480 [Entophlyctis luteolus]|nr:hypothetical protein HDU83_005480 [Entophlyctis luteolus]